MCKSVFKFFKSLVHRKIFCLSGPKVRRDDHDEEEEVNYPAPLLSSGSDNHQHCIDIHTVPVVVAGPGGDDDDNNNNNKGDEQIRHPAAPAPVPFPFLFPGSSDDLDEIVLEVEDIYKNTLKEDYNSKATTTTATDLLGSRLFGDNRLNYVNNGYQSWKPCFKNGHDLDLGGVVPTSTSTDSIRNTSAAAALIIDLDDLDDREEEEDHCSIIPIKNEKKKDKTKVKKKKSCNIIDGLLPNPNPNPLGQTTRYGSDVWSVKGKDKQQHIQNINGGTTSTTSNAIIRGEKKKIPSPPLFLHHHRYLGQAQCGWSVNEEATSKQHHIHNVNTNGGQKKKTTTAAAAIGIIKWVGLYNSSQSILAVGEGDFSFSASLATVFGSASKMIATSLDEEKFLLDNYRRAELNLAQLRQRGCVVKHKVNATTMARDKLLRSRKFDRIIYNFPHAGFTFTSEPNEVQISVHQALVRGFLANAKMMLEKDGQVHITHKCNGFHRHWNIVALACSEGLELLEEVPFNNGSYPGYRTKYGFGGDRNFNCYPSKTYIFVLRD